MMNLKKIKSMLFDDIELVLSNLGMEYEIMGDNIYSNCPVHEGSDNKRGFSLSIDRQVWRCWTRDCQQGYSNDILGLIRGVLSQQTGDEASFRDALMWACKILNINNKDVKVERCEESNEFVKMVALLSQRNICQSTNITSVQKY